MNVARAQSIVSAEEIHTQEHMTHFLSSRGVRYEIGFSLAANNKEKKTPPSLSNMEHSTAGDRLAS